MNGTEYKIIREYKNEYSVNEVLERMIKAHANDLEN